MDIYWIQDKQKQGPASVIDVISLLEDGQLMTHTKGWHKGCATWLPLSELPALAAHFMRQELKDNESSTSPTLPPIPEGLGSLSPPVAAATAVPRMIISPPPVLRFWARTVDLLIYAVLGLGLLRLFNAPFSIYYFSPLSWLPYCLLEGLALHYWKMTPGKWLMGICVTDLRDKPLSLGKATKRTVLVLTVGMGCMLGWIILIMVIFSWFSLRRNLISYWDRNVPSLTQSLGKGGPERIIAAAILIYLLLQLLGWLVSPWVSTILELQKNMPSLF